MKGYLYCNNMSDVVLKEITLKPTFLESVDYALHRYKAEIVIVNELSE